MLEVSSSHWEFLRLCDGDMINGKQRKRVEGEDEKLFTNAALLNERSATFQDLTLD
jgi:hypothetical protein